jgi:mRNA-degrading endonuclease RelE of RelBE toxin-antitoxin system
MFTIEYTKDAVKALKQMPRTTATIIMQKIDTLAANPFAQKQLRQETGKQTGISSAGGSLAGSSRAT